MFTSPGTAFHSHLCSDTLDYLAIGTNRSEASLSARKDLLSGKNDHVMIMYECMGFVFWPPTVWVGPPVWDFQLCDLGEFQNFKPTVSGACFLFFPFTTCTCSKQGLPRTPSSVMKTFQEMPDSSVGSCRTSASPIPIVKL